MYKIRKAVSLAVGLLVMLMVSCTDKAPQFPDLEGYWKQEQITDNATGESVACHRLFWGIQLGVMEIKDLGDNGLGMYICRYDYDEGAGTLRLHDFRKRGNQSVEPDAEKLAGFGIPSEDVTFRVIQLDGHRMVLRADETTLYFRSF